MAAFRLPPDPTPWVFAGGSITQGVSHTYGARSWAEHVHERLRWQMDRLTDTVINSGVAGWTAPQVLAQFEHLTARHRPQVISPSLGTNDCLAWEAGLPDFSKALGELIVRSKALGAQVVVQTPVLVDHESHWRARFGEGDPTPWMDDHTHPNAVGHAHMANHLLQTLGLGRLKDIHLLA